MLAGRRMSVPGPFAPEFLDDLFYAPEVFFFDRIERLDRETMTIVCRMPTDQPLPITVAQRGDPRVHPRHVNGGVIMHATGMLGWAHAYHLNGLRHAEGWVGYGTHIHDAKFKKLVTLDAPMFCRATQLRARRLAEKIFATYELVFEQNESVVFESKQSAMWMKVAPREVGTSSNELPIGDNA